VTTDTTGVAYLFDNADPEAAHQVQLLAAILDQHTRDVLVGLDLEGCTSALDLGAGAGTIAHFLADGCGIETVVALDANPQHIRPDERIEIRQQNVADADLGDRQFDLIHARLLFMHQPHRDQLLKRAVAALRPGGHLVLSDWDCTRLDDMLLTADPPLVDAFTAFQEALVRGGQRIGMDPGWARRLPAAMLAAGLTEVQAVVHNQFWTGGQPGMQLHATNSRQLEPQLLAAGVTAQQLQILRDGMQEPTVNGYSYPMYTAVGRRPR
jgi:SAM-dependent methyltransferase